MTCRVGHGICMLKSCSRGLWSVAIFGNLWIRPSGFLGTTLPLLCGHLLWKRVFFCKTRQESRFKNGKSIPRTNRSFLPISGTPSRLASSLKVCLTPPDGHQESSQLFPSLSPKWNKHYRIQPVAFPPKGDQRSEWGDCFLAANLGTGPLIPKIFYFVFRNVL